MKIFVRPELEDKLLSILEGPEIRALLSTYGLTIDRTTHLTIRESSNIDNDSAVLDKDERVLTLESEFLNTATDEQLLEVLSHEMSHYARSETGLEGTIGADSDPSNPDEFAVIQDDVNLKRMQGYSIDQLKEYLNKRFKKTPLTAEQVEALVHVDDVVKDVGYDRPPHIEVGSIKDLTALSLPLGIAFHALKSNSSKDYPIVKDALSDFINKMSIGLSMIKDEIYAEHRKPVIEFIASLDEAHAALSGAEFYSLSRDQIYSAVGEVSVAVMEFMGVFKYIDVKFGHITEQIKRIDMAFEVYNAEHGVVKNASSLPFKFNLKAMGIYKQALTEDEIAAKISELSTILNGTGNYAEILVSARQALEGVEHNVWYDIVANVYVELSQANKFARVPLAIALMPVTARRSKIVSWVGMLVSRFANAIPTEPFASFISSVNAIIPLKDGEEDINKIVDWVVGMTHKGANKPSANFMDKAVYEVFGYDKDSFKLVLEHRIHEMDRNVQIRILKAIYGNDVELPENLRARVEEAPKPVAAPEVDRSVSPFVAIKKAEMIMVSEKRRPTELEKYILHDVAHSAVYAATLWKNLRERFKDIEDIVKTQPKAASVYACVVIKGEWKDGESMIASDAESALRYAEMGIKKPFPLGEKTILSNRECLSKYLRLFKDEVPSIITRNNVDAVGMANMAVSLGERIPGVEPTILESASTALIYATGVFRNMRWPEGEKILATDPNVAMQYMKQLHAGEKAEVMKLPMWKEAFKPIVKKTKAEYDAKLGNVLVDGQKMYNTRTRPFTHSVHVSVHELSYYTGRDPGSTRFTWAICADDACKPISEGGGGLPIEIMKSLNYTEHGVAPMDPSALVIGFMYGSYTPGVGIWINEIQSDKLQHSFVIDTKAGWLANIDEAIAFREGQIRDIDSGASKARINESIRALNASLVALDDAIETEENRNKKNQMIAKKPKIQKEIDAAKVKLEKLTSGTLLKEIKTKLEKDTRRKSRDMYASFLGDNNNNATYPDGKGNQVPISAFKTQFENYFSGFSMVCVNAAANFARDNNIPKVYWSTSNRVSTVWGGEEIHKHFVSIYDEQLAGAFGAKKNQPDSPQTAKSQFWEFELTPDNLKKIASLARHIFDSKVSLAAAVRRYIPVLVEVTMQEGDLRGMCTDAVFEFCKTVFFGDTPTDLQDTPAIVAMVDDAFASITPQEKEEMIGRKIRAAYPDQDFAALQAAYTPGELVAPGAEGARPNVPTQESEENKLRTELSTIKKKINELLDSGKTSEIPTIVKRIKEIEEELGVDPSSRTFKGFLVCTLEKFAMRKTSADEDWLFPEYQRELDATIEAAERANSLFVGDWDNAKITRTSALVECSNQRASMHIQDFFTKIGFKIDTRDMGSINFYIDSETTPPVSKAKIVDRLIQYFAEDNKKSSYYFSHIHKIQLVSGENEITYAEYKKEQEALKNKTSLTAIAHYTGVVLDEASRTALVTAMKDLIPAGWDVVAHHMTVNMGAPKPEDAGKDFSMTAVAFAKNDKVAAVKVETDAPSAKSTKHITVAVNRAGGGKPFMSDQLTEWNPIEPVSLTGKVTEENAPKQAFLQFVADLPSTSINPGSGNVSEMMLTPEERKKEKTQMFTRMQNPETALDLANIDEYNNGSEGKPNRDLSWMNDAIQLPKDDNGERYD